MTPGCGRREASDDSKSGKELTDIDRVVLDQRERVFEALLDLCLEKPMSTISFAELADRSGQDRESLEGQFEDIEDCFCAKLMIERGDFFSRLERAVAGQRLWVDRLRSVAYALLRYLQSDFRRRHFLTTELNRAGERATLIWTETIVKPLFDLVDEGRKYSSGFQSRATAEAVGGGIFYQVTIAAETDRLDEAAIPSMMYSAVLPYLGEDAAELELSKPPPPR